MVTHGVITRVRVPTIIPGITSPTAIVVIGAGAGVGGQAVPLGGMGILTPHGYPAQVGQDSVLGKSYLMIYRQSRAPVVAINVNDTDAGIQLGLAVLLDVEQRLSTPGNPIRPEFILLPGYGSVGPDDGAENPLLVLAATRAEEMRARVIAECPIYSLAAAQDWNMNNGGDRIIGVVPNINALGIDDGPGSALLAGAIARNDAVVGRHASTSNVEVPNVTYPFPAGGISSLGQPYQSITAGAAVLDGSNIHSFVKRDGRSYTWGGTTSYTPADDVRRFIGVARQLDEIFRRFISLALQFSGRGITAGALSRFTNSGNLILSNMKAARQILYGKVRLSPGENTVETLAEGKIFVDLDYTPVYPIRLVTYNISITNTGLLEILGG